MGNQYIELKKCLELKTVTFEQAIALKELGFPQYSGNYSRFLYFIIGNKSKVWCSPYDIRSFNEKKEVLIEAPYLEVAAKWLRNEKDFHIFPTPMVKWDNTTETYCCPHYECFFTTSFGSPIRCTVYDKHETFTPKEFSSYDEALSAGIDEAIHQLTLKDNDKD